MMENAAQFFAWLLCWHDIGKFSRSFQQLYALDNLCMQKDSQNTYEKNIPCVTGILAMGFPTSAIVQNYFRTHHFPFVNLSV